MSQAPVDYFEVTIIAYTVIVVKAATQDEAYQIARDEVDLGDCDLEEGSAKQLNIEDVPSALRHANKVARDLKAERKAALDAIRKGAS